MALSLWESGKVEWSEFAHLSIVDLLDMTETVRAVDSARRRAAERERQKAEK